MERSSNTTGRPTGTWISLAVVTQFCGQRIAVLHFPPPLVAGHPDLKRLLAGVGGDGAANRDIEDQEDEQE